MRCKTKQKEGSRSANASKKFDEINDRPVRRGGRTEFGLPPSHYEGRFGNGAPFAFCHSCLGRFFHLIDAFFDFLHRGVQFFENFMLFPG